MRPRDSRLDRAQVTTARTLLQRPVRRDRIWPVLAAATALALTALLFASVAVLAPPVSTEHVARGGPE